MSVDPIFDRGMVRGKSIWPMFKYQIPGMTAAQVVERVIIFGIYSGAYIHGYNYLHDVTYEQLSNMLLSYTQSMAELTADEQKAVIDISAKRYIEDQKLAEKDAALVNKSRKVDQKEAEVDAKFTALENDRQALATKVVELQVLQAKVATRITELEARISEQEYEAASVEAEITRQELIAQKADLEVIEVGIRSLEIQAQISDAAFRLAQVDIKKVDLQSDINKIALEMAEVDVRKSQTEAETARLETQTAYESLTEKELEVARAETTAYRQETVLKAARGPLLTQRIAAADEEINVTIPRLSQVIEDERAADSDTQRMRSQHSVLEYNNRQRQHDERADTSIKTTELELQSHDAEAEQIASNAGHNKRVYLARVSAQANRYSGAMTAADMMMQANIVNTMTHSIGAAK